MTFSIVAREADGASFGIAIASSSPAVAARCAHARAGVGVVATQNITDPSLGPTILDALQRGSLTDAALHDALARTPHAGYRQLVVIGREGRPAIHSGSHALGVVGTAVGAHCAAAGNLLADSAVPQAMVTGFEQAQGSLAERLLTALRCGAVRGGEAGPVHSAGILVVRDVSWPIVDLRSDWSDSPVADLRALWIVYAPQVEDYIRRALDPTGAPTFGVPGNL